MSYSVPRGRTVPRPRPKQGSPPHIPRTASSAATSLAAIRAAILLRRRGRPQPSRDSDAAAGIRSSSPRSHVPRPPLKMPAAVPRGAVRGGGIRRGGNVLSFRVPAAAAAATSPTHRRPRGHAHSDVPRGRPAPLRPRGRDRARLAASSATAALRSSSPLRTADPVASSAAAGPASLPPPLPPRRPRTPIPRPRPQRHAPLLLSSRGLVLGDFPPRPSTRGRVPGVDLLRGRKRHGPSGRRPAAASVATPPAAAPAQSRRPRRRTPCLSPPGPCDVHGIPRGHVHGGNILHGRHVASFINNDVPAVVRPMSQAPPSPSRTASRETFPGSPTSGRRAGASGGGGRPEAGRECRCARWTRVWRGVGNGKYCCSALLVP